MDLMLKGRASPANRIISVMAMHSRDWGTWFVNPAGVLGIGFAICLFLDLFIAVLLGRHVTGGFYVGAVSALYFVMLAQGVITLSGTFPFAVGFGARRRDYFLGTLAMGGAVSATWAVLLGLLSLVEANVIKDWGVDLHFFHLPFFSDGAPARQFCWTTYCTAQSNPNYFHNGAPMQQFWVYFALLLFMYLLGMLIGSIYQRFGRTGIYILLVAAVLLLSVFFLVSAYVRWWGAISDWLAPQTATILALWLVPPMACFALISFALLRKATV
jgi:hypothetical protein